jgi:hypothetical protein
MDSFMRDLKPAKIARMPLIAIRFSTESQQAADYFINECQ